MIVLQLVGAVLVYAVVASAMLAETAHRGHGLAALARRKAAGRGDAARG